MAEERTYRITCNECGYSEEVPQSRLTYEEGKTCPRCYRGKMYWVPPAEKARRRAMPEEERRIPIAWVIPPLLLLGAGGALGLAVALAREEEAPPEEGPPEEVPPVVLANILGIVSHAGTGTPLANVSVQLWSPDGEELLLYTSTDSAGYYSMADVSPGNYLIRVEKEGYETVVSDISLVQGNNELNVEMVPILLTDEFYMPSKITDISIWEHDILQWHYHQITYRVRITNYGNAPGTHTISWEHYYNGTMFSDGQAQITLQPGESYEWSGIVDVDFSRCTKATCKLYGDWPENNYSEGVVIEGVPVS